jgi:hypothetical protein
VLAELHTVNCDNQTSVTYNEFNKVQQELIKSQAENHYLTKDVAQLREELKVINLQRLEK